MIEPGAVCPECARRVPHPRKQSSPKSGVLSYRMPQDELDAHRETLGVVSQYIGTAGRPFEVFWTLTYALARVLQDEEMRGIAQRRAE